MERTMLKFVFIPVFVLWVNITLHAQKTAILTDEYEAYHKAIDLYDKGKYSAAQNKFGEVLEKIERDDEIHINAEFYYALCALKLLHPDAEFLLQRFIINNPESPQVRTVHLNLGRHYFDRKLFRKAAEYFEIVDVYDLNSEEKAEYYFKLGYSYFELKEFDNAANKFFEIKDKESTYQMPALYYYSHIAYQNAKYEAALEGFLKLQNDSNFKQIVPYYITQIYFLQSRYDEVIKYALPKVDSISGDKGIEISKLIGSSYYKTNQFDKAIPFLNKYINAFASTRADHYELGYSYYRTGDNQNAVKHFNRVIGINDAMSQTAYYHMGDAYVKLDEKMYARNAYQGASKMSFDKKIEEDATFSYAKLAYELSYNPFHEALVALHDYLEKYPNSERKDEAYSFLINVYLTTKNYEQAANALEKIKDKDIRMKTAYQFVVYNKGVESFLNGKFTEAITYLKKVKTYPLDKELNYQSKYWIAESYYHLMDYDKAIPAYEDFVAEPGAYSSEYYTLAYYNIGYSWYTKSFSGGKYDADYFGKSLAAFRKFITDADEKEYKRKSDAAMRVADIYYAQSDNDNAIKFYETAMKFNSETNDYALFHMGLCYKFGQKDENAISTYKKIIDNYSSSKFVADAKFEIADIYRVADKRTNAIDFYKDFMLSYPNHPKVKDALLSLGQLHYLNKDYTNAEKYYKRVLSEYKDKGSINSAIIGLNPVYMATGRMDEYKALVEQYGLGDEMKDKLEDDYYDAAAKYVLEEKDCEKAIEGFNKYLRDFPNGKHALKAHSYRGGCLYENKQYDLAIADFEKVLEFTNNSFTMDAAWHLAVTYYYQKKDYALSLKYYDRMEQVSTKPKDLHNAYVGKLYCYSKLGDHENAAKYGDIILTDATSTEDEKTRANYSKANAAFNAMDYDNAVKYYKAVYAVAKNVLGAECRYQVCYIYYIQKQFKKSETEIFDLSKQKPSYDYWVAKAYILLADNYVELKDNFQAKATLQSIIDNYTYEDEIVPTAKEKLQKILDSESMQDGNKRKMSNDMEIDMENGGKINEVEKENTPLPSPNNETPDKE